MNAADFVWETYIPHASPLQQHPLSMCTDLGGTPVYAAVVSFAGKEEKYVSVCLSMIS